MVANPFKSGVSIERRSAQLAQWVAYLALSAAIGLFWAGLYVLLMKTAVFGGADLLMEFFVALPWSLAASLSAGLIYRLTALVKGHLPSIWYSTLIPGLGSVFFVLMVASQRPLDPSELVMMLAGSLAITYICGGIFIIPLALLHTKALQWLHVKLTEWAPRASIRAIRHVGYATLCGGLLVATEVPRYLDWKACEHAQTVGETFGVKMPKKSYVLSTRDNVDPETYLPQEDAHFRVPGGMPWPPVEEAVDLSQGENTRQVRDRFLDVAGQALPENASLEQVKWYEPGGWIEASRLRTPEADFVEFRRH